MKAFLSKVFCFSLLFAHVYFSSVGQTTYVSLAKKGNEWTTYLTSRLGISTYHHYYEKDTLISNTLYGVIKGRSTYLIRQDKGKVYLSWTSGTYLGEEYTKEVLRYDFTLQEKDTFYTSYGSPEYLMLPTKMVVSAVDSVVLEDGTKRKRITLDVLNRENPLVWIEGIGSTYGLDYFTHYSTSLPVHLSCFSYEGTALWKSSLFNLDCISRITTGLETEDISLQNLVHVFPNPTRSSLTLQNKSYETFYFQLFNASGQKVLVDDRLEIYDQKILQLSEFPSGIYFLKMVGESGKHICKSIQVL